MVFCTSHRKSKRHDPVKRAPRKSKERDIEVRTRMTIQSNHDRFTRNDPGAHRDSAIRSPVRGTGATCSGIGIPHTENGGLAPGGIHGAMPGTNGTDHRRSAPQIPRDAHATTPQHGHYRSRRNDAGNSAGAARDRRKNAAMGNPSRHPHRDRTYDERKRRSVMKKQSYCISFGTGISIMVSTIGARSLRPFFPLSDATMGNLPECTNVCTG